MTSPPPASSSPADKKIAALKPVQPAAPGWWTWWVLIAAVVWVAVLLVPVMSHRGWPNNHDNLAPVSRMAALLGQWQVGHWIPAWSSHQQEGFGSPMVILYHKLHMYLSTALLALTGHVKTALVLPIALSMLGGMAGMVFCLRQFIGTRHRALQLLVAAMLPATNYATFDWFVRGAAAEFAAMMVLPWIFGWCARLLVRGVWQVWIGAALGLLALAHSTLGLFALLPLMIACGLAVVRWRDRIRSWLKPIVASALLGLLFVAPFVLPMAAMARFNRVERLSVPYYFVPRLNMIDWREFFWSSTWQWGDAKRITFQIDLALLLLFPVFLIFLTRRHPWRGTCDRLPAPDRRILAVFLLGTVAVMGWLQTSFAFWFYDVVPGAALLQFAWRLLAFLTVAGLVCAGIALAEISDALGGRFGKRGLAAGTLLAFLAVAGTAEPKMWWHKSRILWHSPEEIAQTLKANEYWAFGEFLPKVDWQTGNDLLAAQAQTIDWMLALPEQGCKISPSPLDTAGPEKERAVGYWTVDCPAAQPAWLRLFLAPGMEVSMQPAGAPGDGWQRTVPTRSCSDPRIRIGMPAGASTVRVTFPTWRLASQSLFHRKPFDFRRDCAPAR